MGGMGGLAPHTIALKNSQSYFSEAASKKWYSYFSKLFSYIKCQGMYNEIYYYTIKLYC